VALNKSNSPIWVKVLIIILIVAFVSLFMYTGIAGIFDLFKQSPTATTGSTSTAQTVTSINQENQPRVDAFKQMLVSDPASYTAQANLANAYFDWAQQLAGLQTGKSTPTTEAMTATFDKWQLAKQAYDTATKLSKSFEPALQTDRSYAAFFSNETTEALEIATTVTKKAPTFAQGWSHLGIYLEELGRSKEAIPAYQKYLALDPNGQTASFIKDRLKNLGVSTTTTGTSSATTKAP
jgi:Flp pilus assembly protein TadD